MAAAASPHLFEHMMFKGNEHMTPDMFDNLTENIGGENNAYTADDVTVYHETVPSNYLNPLLWAEAERMSAVALNDKNFAPERDVVKEEYRPADPGQSLRRILSEHTTMSRGYRLLFVLLMALIITYVWADISGFSLNDFNWPSLPRLRCDSPESFRGWRLGDYAPASASETVL